MLLGVHSRAALVSRPSPSRKLGSGPPPGAVAESIVRKTAETGAWRGLGTWASENRQT